MKIFLKSIYYSLLAFVINAYIFWGFANTYSSKILNYNNFKTQFETGVYQYRILSSFLFDYFYQFLTTLGLDYGILKFRFTDSNAEPQMYFAYFVFNTFWLILSVFFLIFITEKKEFKASPTEKNLIVLSTLLITGLSQFVLVPYDLSAYFFSLLFFWMLMNFLKSGKNITLFIILLIMVISTINRETSALSISLAATLLFSKYGFTKKTLVPIFWLVVVFLGTYFGLRYFIGSFRTNDGSLWIENFTFAKNYLGMVFWVLLFIFSLMISQNKKTIFIFHLLSLPYIFMSFYTGILFEFRLYIPLFIVSILLSKLTDQTH